MDHARLPVLKRFVVLEGIDGTGTTTQLTALDRSLQAAGIAHLCTHEPTDLETGRLVRRALRGELDVRPETLARLFSADRHEHLYGPGGILERLGAGDLVLCDRYVFSSLAYQGAACGPELPRLLNGDYPLPELLLFFDVDPEVSMRRVEGRGEREIFESLSVQHRVRDSYEAVLGEYASSPMRVARIDAGRPLAEVGEAVREAVGGLIGTRLAAVP